MYCFNTAYPLKRIKVGLKNKDSKWMTKAFLVSRNKLKCTTIYVKPLVAFNFKKCYTSYKKTYKKVILATKVYEVTNKIKKSNNIHGCVSTD